MEPYIDRQLTKKIKTAGESGQVEAIIVAREDSASSATEEDGELVRRMIENTIECTGDYPISLRYFPKANAAVISASGGFIQAILQSEDLAVASTTEMDAITFLFP
jgi:hypothetical protein